ncbi:MAG: glycosyltransferase family 4 protein [Planctomycetota bacterium]
MLQTDGKRQKGRGTRVLHVRVVNGAGGGPDKTILRSPRVMDSSRYTLSAAYLADPEDPGLAVLQRTALEQGCPFESIDDRGPLDWRVLPELLDLCRRDGVQVWHAHDYKSEVIGLLLRRRHPMKLVTTLHGFTRDTWKTRLYARIADHAIKRYDHAFAVSPELVEHCHGLGMSEERVTPLPNAIDTSVYQRTRSRGEAREELGMASDAVVVGVIARLSIEKGVDRAIKILPTLAKLNERVELHVIGDGPEQDRLKAQVQRLGMTGRVFWHGWQRDVKPYLEAMHALLLPSRTEGLPNAVLEAMAVGVPVAATAVGAVSEALDEGRCGRLLGRHEEDWPWALSGLLQPSSHVATQVTAARERVVKKYGFAQRMAKVAAVYDRLLGVEATPQVKPETRGGRRAA